MRSRSKGEYSGVFGLPDNAVAVPGGALGTGASYFAEHPHTDQNDVHLKQLYLTAKPELLHVPGLWLTAGRFEVRDGLEYRSGDAKFRLPEDGSCFTAAARSVRFRQRRPELRRRPRRL